jgi:hypothetical protein
MARKQQLADTEAFVRKVLIQIFKQKADRETVRSVAEKVTQVIAESTPKKASGAPKNKAA